ncbi:MAG TPA: DNA-processing protein DprA [Candidatus Dependentiae bacterium]|nr:DNA-processing protein DprA [Candidatus Dependentiae bacterium]HRQ62549.1 DNA-processing protein DprA [Candidatus Dependentiae bacterium]
MKLSDQHIILHLSLITGIGPATLTNMIQAKPESMTWSDVYACDVQQLVLWFGMTERIAQSIVTGLQDFSLIHKELDLIQRHDISWATLSDAEYPQLLRHIHAPPAVIYWQGRCPQVDTMIAIVGARKANYYGQRVINQVVPVLVENGWTIVSGGAIGADTMAHRATLAAKGSTVVVLGSGLLEPYPSSNNKLFKEIVACGGTVLSSFPLGMQGLPGNFPARNRIISGLSKGCVVVQAAIQSGARITAQYALEQGREVFAVPGPIDDPLSAGCHALIQEGAKLVTSAQDIITEFTQSYGVGYVQQNLFVEPACESPIITTLEGKIVRACSQPKSTDDLVAEFGLDLSQIQVKLFELQLAGQVEQDFTGMWVAR